MGYQKTGPNSKNEKTGFRKTWSEWSSFQATCFIMSIVAVIIFISAMIIAFVPYGGNIVMGTLFGGLIFFLVGSIVYMAVEDFKG